MKGGGRINPKQKSHATKIPGPFTKKRAHPSPPPSLSPSLYQRPKPAQAHTSHSIERNPFRRHTPTHTYLSNQTRRSDTSNQLVMYAAQAQISVHTLLQLQASLSQAQAPIRMVAKRKRCFFSRADPFVDRQNRRVRGENIPEPVEFEEGASGCVLRYTHTYFIYVIAISALHTPPTPFPNPASRRPLKTRTDRRK